MPSKMINKLYWDNQVKLDQKYFKLQLNKLLEYRLLDLYEKSQTFRGKSINQRIMYRINYHFKPLSTSIYLVLTEYRLNKNKNLESISLRQSLNYETEFYHLEIQHIQQLYLLAMGCNPSTEQVEPILQLPTHNIEQHHSPPHKHPQSNTTNQPTPQIQPQTINPEKQNLEEEKKKDISMEQALQKFVGQIFYDYDVNKRGTLNIVQFGKLLKDHVDPNISQQEIKEFFGIADLSGDKKLDKKELFTLYRTLIKY